MVTLEKSWSLLGKLWSLFLIFRLYSHGTFFPFCTTIEWKHSKLGSDSLRAIGIMRDGVLSEGTHWSLWFCPVWNPGHDLCKWVFCVDTFSHIFAPFSNKLCFFVPFSGNGNCIRDGKRDENISRQEAPRALLTIQNAKPFSPATDFYWWIKKKRKEGGEMEMIFCSSFLLSVKRQLLLGKIVNRFCTVP